MTGDPRHPSAVIVFATMLPAAAAAAATAAPASSGSGGRGRGFAYGVAIADANAGPGGSFDLAHQAGFTNALVVLNWANVERPDSRFAWDLGEANDLDNFLA